jgi:hypothetical protein
VEGTNKKIRNILREIMIERIVETGLPTCRQQLSINTDVGQQRDTYSIWKEDTNCKEKRRGGLPDNEAEDCKRFVKSNDTTEYKIGDFVSRWGH